MIVTALVCASAPADASFPGANGLIAFGSPVESTGDRAITAIRPDGTGLRTLVARGADDPDWSADGRRLLFRHQTCSPGVTPCTATATALDVAAGKVVPLPFAGLLPFARGGHKASFAPDGRRFAYAGMEDPAVIYTARVDAAGAHPLRRGSSPRWSPDGRRTAYMSPDDRLCTMAATTGRQRRCLTPALRRPSRPDWSPDGRSLVVATNAADGSATIHLLRADRTRSSILGIDRPVLSVAWSPDGRSIAFAGFDGYEGERDEDEVGAIDLRQRIWVMNTSGERRRRIYTSPWYSEDTYFPATLSWQPVARRAKGP